MKTHNQLLFFCFIFFTQIGWTQGLGKKNVNETYYEAVFENLSFAKDTTFLPSEKNDSIISGGQSAISDFRLAVISGDLYIRFDIAVEGEEYKIEWKGIDSKNSHLLDPNNIYGKIDTLIRKADLRSQEIVIANTAENSNPLLLSGKVKVKFKVTVIDYISYYTSFWKIKFKCNQPVEKWHKKRVNLILPIAFTGAGIGLLLWDKDYEPSYTRYKRHQSNSNTAKENFKEAQRIRDNNVNRKNWGIALLLASAAWIGIQDWRNAERKKVCRESCCPPVEECKKCKSVSLDLFSPNPDFEFSNDFSISPSFAVGIKYTF